MKKIPILFFVLILGCGGSNLFEPLEADADLADADEDGADKELSSWLKDICSPVPDSNYWFCSNATDWTTAMLWCDHVGDRLATPVDEELHNLITTGVVIEVAVWLGGFHAPTEEWHWISGEEWVWDNGGVGGISSWRCLTMYHTGAWRAADCGSEYPFICEEVP